MKKEYIIPSMELIELRADMPMMTVSGHTDDTLKQDVDFEKDPTDKHADGRRTYNVWDDEEEEEQQY